METIKLTNSEWIIMTALWEKNMTITQLTHHFKETHGWSKNVIINFLKKMRAKKAVDFIQEPKVKVFYPLISRKEISVNESLLFLNKVYEGRITLMVDLLIKNNMISDEEFSKMKAALNKYTEE